MGANLAVSRDSCADSDPAAPDRSRRRRHDASPQVTRRSKRHLPSLPLFRPRHVPQGPRPIVTAQPFPMPWRPMLPTAPAVVPGIACPPPFRVKTLPHSLTET